MSITLEIFDIETSNYTHTHIFLLNKCILINLHNMSSFQLLNTLCVCFLYLNNFWKIWYRNFNHIHNYIPFLCTKTKLWHCLTFCYFTLILVLFWKTYSNNSWVIYNRILKLCTDVQLLTIPMNIMNPGTPIFSYFSNHII